MTKPPREAARPRHKPHPSGVQGRSATARHWRRVYDSLVNEWVDANYAGDKFTADTVTVPPTELDLIKRATTIRCRLAALDQRVADGADIDDGILVRLGGQLSRTLRALGLEGDNGNGKSGEPGSVLEDLKKNRPPVDRAFEDECAAWLERQAENVRLRSRGHQPLPELPYPWGSQKQAAANPSGGPRREEDRDA